MSGEEKTRLRYIALAIFVVGAIFIGRLYMLQVVKGNDFRAEGERQYIATLPHLYDRGSIFFQEKTGKLVAAATIESGYLMAIDPSKIEDKEFTYTEINEVYPIDREEFMRKAARSEDPYEEIAKRIPDAKGLLIKNKKLPGVHLFRETWRYYPGGDLAASTVGFVAFQGDDLTGRYGLERFYNDTLDRKEEQLYVNFFAEIFSNLRRSLFEEDVEESGDIVLSIEPNVQSYLEDEIATVMEEWKSDQTGAVVIDPATGRVIAMAVNPSFDLNHFNTVKDQRRFSNPMVENVYEMGSIVKPLTVAAGIDTGVITAKSVYNDTGSITLNNKTISNYDGRGRGPGTNMQTVLNQSLNTGVAYVVSRLGHDRFSEYMLSRFQIGQETGIDLPGESQGLIKNLESNREVEFATASFGQGIAISPINMTQALSVLANGGKVITPHVVDAIHYSNGDVKTIVPNPSKQAIKKETTDEITRMLVEVVDSALLGGSVKVPEYSIAAKTGTAQIARPRDLGGGYYDDRYLHTFFGYFPAYDPKFLVFFYTYYPKDAEFASHTLTHPFMRTARFLLNYYAIPPDRDVNGEKIVREFKHHI